jgi:hypothetical protein
MMADPVSVAVYRSEQERHQWVRIEDVQHQHQLSDGQIIDAWRKGRILPRVDVPRSDFHDTAGGCFVHLGDYPLQVDDQYIASFSAEGVATIGVVRSSVLQGDPAEWDGGLLTTPDGRCMVDYGRVLVLDTPISTRLGALWIGADEVARLIEQPADEVMAESLRDAIAPEPAPPRGKKLGVQIVALVQVIKDMGIDQLNIPDDAKGSILAECLSLRPELFPPKTGALSAWRKASREGVIRHNQKHNQKPK